MKVVRRSVFETNSSSTHSISIYKWTPTKEYPIPRNSEIDICGEVSAQTEIKDEMGKLKYIICMLASIADRHEEDYIDNEDDISYIGSNYKEKYFAKLIESNPFTWIKEVIKEKCNTTIKYISNGNYFPYYETVYDNYDSLESILDCDLNNEKSFKDRIIEIIFDENMIIENKETEN